MKKLLPILKWGCCLLLALGLCANWIVRSVTSREWFRNYAIEKTEQALHRQVRADSIGASLLGVRLRGVSIAEEGGFEKGEFVTINRAQMYISLLHLLRNHVKIHQLVLQGVQLNIARLPNGKFNFESIGGESAPVQEADKQEAESPFKVTFENVSFDDLSFIYKDLQDGQTFAARGIALGVKNFAVDKEFPLTLNTTLHYKDATQDILLPVGLTSKVQLAGLDFSKAYADDIDVSLKYQKNLLRLKGRVENWREPKFQATLSSKNLSSKVASPWAQLPDFEWKEASVYAAGQVKTTNHTLLLSSGTIHIPGGDLSLSGRYNYGKDTYDAKGDCTIDLTEVYKWLPKEDRKIGLKGFLSGTFQADTQKFQTNFSLREGTYFHSATGQFSNILATITATESMDFKTGNLSGKMEGDLNQNPFKLDLTVVQKPQSILAQLNAAADRIVLPAATQDKTEKPEFVEDVQIAPLPQPKWSLPPIHLKSNVKVGALEGPYLRTNSLQFSSDLEGITAQLNQAHGIISLKLGGGKILDLYRLTNANALTKVLFLSLNITGKVFNSLNVFSVLNGVKNGVVKAVTGKKKEKTPERMIVQTVLDEEGNPVEVMVPYAEDKSKGQMAYEKFETDVYFDHGVASVKRGTFVSDTISFRLDGTTDFHSGDINMKVHAAPGKHEVDGMLPLSISITGTVGDPKGKMNMVGSVTSLLKQTVSHNVVSRQVKKGVKGFFGLFKKKADETETSQEEGNIENPPEEKDAKNTEETENFKKSIGQ